MKSILFSFLVLYLGSLALVNAQSWTGRWVYSLGGEYHEVYLCYNEETGEIVGRYDSAGQLYAWDMSANSTVQASGHWSEAGDYHGDLKLEIVAETLNVHFINSQGTTEWLGIPKSTPNPGYQCPAFESDRTGSLVGMYNRKGSVYYVCNDNDNIYASLYDADGNPTAFVYEGYQIDNEAYVGRYYSMDCETVTTGIVFGYLDRSDKNNLVEFMWDKPNSMPARYTQLGTSMRASSERSSEDTMNDFAQCMGAQDAMLAPPELDYDELCEGRSDGSNNIVNVNLGGIMG